MANMMNLNPALMKSQAQFAPLTSAQPVSPMPEALHSLVASIWVSAKTLDAYLLDDIPVAPLDTFAAHASFFVTLSSPPSSISVHPDSSS